jgi:hypothetical protein
MGRLYYQDYKPKQLTQFAQKQAAAAVTQKKIPNSSSKSAKTAVIINSKIYQNECELTSLIMPKRTITTIEEAPGASLPLTSTAAPRKNSSDDEYFKEELKILSIKDENLRNFKILSSDQRTMSMLRKSTGGGGGESKFSQSFRQSSIKTKNSSIALEDSGEFESILKEFYELK